MEPLQYCRSGISIFRTPKSISLISDSGKLNVFSGMLVWALAAMFLVGLSISENASRAEAQQKPSSGDGLVVDVVSLKSGRSLRGAILSQQPNGPVLIAVSKEWLKSANPTLAEKTLKENQEDAREAWTQCCDRIAELVKSRSDSPHLVFYYKEELDRLKKLIADPNPIDPDFLWMEVRHEAIGKVQRTSADRSRIAVFAWNERLPRVESRDASGLQKELTARGVKLEDPLPNLFDRLPARKQSDEEWAARIGLVEYSIGKPLDFQGMGETLARTGHGQGPNLAEVLPKLLKQQLGSLFDDLLSDVRPAKKAKEDEEWLSAPIRTAVEEKVRGFRVTRLELDAATSQVIVETRFVAQIASGNWKTVWLGREVGDGTKPRPEAEARIEQDPQLKTAIETIKSVGLVDGGAIKRAIRIGAATMSAQQSADGVFSQFCDRYHRHLDGPPLTLIKLP